MANLQVIIESPFANAEGLSHEEALEYARQCCLHSLSLGEAPFAPHLFYPIRAGGFLDDDVPEERERGIWAGQQWLVGCDKVAVYNDHGVTVGMERGINRAQKKGIKLDFRHLPEDFNGPTDLEEVLKLPE